MRRVECRAPRVVEDHVVEPERERVRSVVALYRRAARAEHVHVLERDGPKVGDLRARAAAVVRVEHQRVADAPHAHVRVTDILHEAAAAAVGLDAKTVGRAVER